MIKKSYYDIENKIYLSMEGTEFTSDMAVTQ